MFALLVCGKGINVTNMAEAVAIVGLIASISSLVDHSTKVVSRLLGFHLQVLGTFLDRFVLSRPTYLYLPHALCLLSDWLGERHVRDSRLEFRAFKIFVRSTQLWQWAYMAGFHKFYSPHNRTLPNQSASLSRPCQALLPHFLCLMLKRHRRLANVGCNAAPFTRQACQLSCALQSPTVRLEAGETTCQMWIGSVSQSLLAAKVPGIIPGEAKQ